MNILRLTWSRMDSYGGIQNHIRNLDATLAAKGIQCHTHMLPSRNPARIVQPGQQQRLSADGFDAALTRLLRDHAIDILHGHNLHLEDAPGIASAVARCASACAVPLVTTIHDLTYEVPRAVIQETLHVLKDAHVVVTSQFNDRGFRDLTGRQPAAIIPPAIDFDKYDARTLPEPRTIAYPGRLCRPKGLLDAVGILGPLASRTGPIHMLLSDRTQRAYGESEAFHAELDREFARHGSLTREFVTGPRAVPSIYQRAALTLAMPRYIEGFGQVPLESLACCRPVVAVPTGGMHWIDGVPGTVSLPERDPARVAAAVEDVLLNWNAWHEDARKGRDIAKATYDVRVTASQYAALYRTLARTTPAESPSFTAGMTVS